MTNKEAIKSLQNIVEYWSMRPSEQEAARLAIKALEQQNEDFQEQRIVDLNKTIKK